MRQVPPYRLWLGHAGDGRDLRQILDAGIDSVVQLAAEEPVLELSRDLVYCRIPLVDGPGNDSRLLQLAISTVVNLLDSERRTLIVCGAGLSRTPSIAAAALALARGQEPDECLKQVAEHVPSDVVPALWDEIKKIVEAGRL